MLDSGYYHNPRAGHNAGDHPPIAPMRCTTELSGDAARIYDYVAQHFIATVRPFLRSLGECTYTIPLHTTYGLFHSLNKRFALYVSRILRNN